MAVVQSFRAAEKLAKKLAADLEATELDARMLAVDGEWIWPSPHELGVDVLQIATPSRMVGVFQLYHILASSGGIVPPALQSLLANDSLKLGVNLTISDGPRLLKGHGIKLGNAHELGTYCEEKGKVTGKRHKLEVLFKVITGRDLDKNPTVRNGNWRKKRLDSLQRQYCANDVLAAQDIWAGCAAQKSFDDPHFTIDDDDEVEEKAAAPEVQPSSTSLYSVSVWKAAAQPLFTDGYTTADEFLITMRGILALLNKGPDSEEDEPISDDEPVQASTIDEFVKLAV